MTKLAEHQKIVPFLFYEDVSAAIGWLSSALGFEEHFRLEMPDGKVMHAEVRMGDAVVALGPADEPRPGPQRSSVYVFVDDVDAHFERAKAAGVAYGHEPQDMPFGDRIYPAFDLENNSWYFAQHLRDMTTDEVRAAMSQRG